MRPNGLWDNTFGTVLFEGRSRYENPSTTQLAFNSIYVTWYGYNLSQGKILRFHLCLWNKAEIRSPHWFPMSISTSALICTPHVTRLTYSTWEGRMPHWAICKELKHQLDTPPCLLWAHIADGLWIGSNAHVPLRSINSEEEESCG